MLYAYQLRAHPNARYQEVLRSLSQKELRCMLASCGIAAQMEPRTLGGADFLCFEADGLTEAQRRFLERLSTLHMTAALENGLLRPLDRAPNAAFLPADLPEIQKYKGKTNTDFTRLLINLALSAGGQWQAEQPRVLDPVCGRGTSLYCALVRGQDAVGIDSDAAALRDAAGFVKKWLQYHKIKHSSVRLSHTLPSGSAPAEALEIRAGNRTLRLEWIAADTRETGALLRRRPAQALVADLPYGVQHAPRQHGHMDTLEGMLAEAMPAWRQALAPGCAAAIAFNTYTLKRDTLRGLAADAGFVFPDPQLYADFSHWVEQAVNRDVLVALNPD